MLFRLTLLLTLQLPLLALAPRGSSTAPVNRPNILFILTDDQRFDTLSCAGHPVVKTPHIDSLAAQGVRFTNAFVTTPICMASRASIFTSLHQATHQVFSFFKPLAPQWVSTAYPAQLRRSGYETGFVGKVHFTIAGQKDPRPEGWYDFYQPVSQPYWKIQPDGSRRHETDISADYALQFLRQRDPAKPFCLSISFNSPHAQDNDHRPGVGLYPWPPSTDGLYDEQTIPAPRLNDSALFAALPPFLQNSLGRTRYFWGLDTAEKYQINLRAYYRMITGVDHAIGKLLAELTQLGLRENTVIIFTSDNGYYLGNRGLSGKWLHHDDSLRVPLIISDPRRPADSTRGSVATAIALNIDFAPTLLDLAQQKSPSSYQGTSLLPLLHSAQPPPGWRTDFFCEHAYPRPEIPKWEGIRSTEFTYARYYEEKPVYEFLYDLKNDPDQIHNLALDPDHANTLNQLRKRCLALNRRYTETSPTKLPSQPLTPPVPILPSTPFPHQ